MKAKIKPKQRVRYTSTSVTRWSTIRPKWATIDVFPTSKKRTIYCSWFFTHEKQEFTKPSTVSDNTIRNILTFWATFQTIPSTQLHKNWKALFVTYKIFLPRCLATVILISSLLCLYIHTYMAKIERYQSSSPSTIQYNMLLAQKYWARNQPQWAAQQALHIKYSQGGGLDGRT